MFGSFTKLLIIASVALAVPSTLVPPTEDSFYSAPEGFETAELGAILAYRNTPAPIKSVYFDVNIKNSYQLLIRSSDSFGNPSAVVTTVFEPYNADPSKLISYQVAQDSAYLNCAPSYSFMNGGGLSTINNQVETVLIQTALDQGYYVVSPDYEGLKSVFTGGIQAAHATLDSIRAALSSENITGINADADTILWGYSGGSLASGWAASLQPSYAPELASNLLGVALGGWVTNITATITSVSGGLFAGLGATGMAGLSNEYPALHDFLKGAMPEDKYEKFSKAYSMCLVDALVEFAGDDWFEGSDKYFTDGLLVLSQEPTYSTILNNTLGLIPEDMPQIPVFVYHGTIDTIVPYNQAERVYDIWCDAGIESFEFAADLTAGHVTEMVQGSGAAFGWIKGVFEGTKKPIKGCKKTPRLTNLLYPGSVMSVTNVVSALVDNILGLNIGPNGENLVLQNNALVSEFNATESS